MVYVKFSAYNIMKNKCTVRRKPFQLCAYITFAIKTFAMISYLPINFSYFDKRPYRKDD